MWIRPIGAVLREEEKSGAECRFEPQGRGGGADRPDHRRGEAKLTERAGEVEWWAYIWLMVEVLGGLGSLPESQKVEAKDE